MSMSRYLSVCLFVCLPTVHSHILKTTWSDFTRISVHVHGGCGSVLLWWHCDALCTSVLWVTSCFHTISGVFLTFREVSPVGSSVCSLRFNKNTHIHCLISCLLTLDLLCILLGQTWDFTYLSPSYCLSWLFTVSDYFYIYRVIFDLVSIIRCSLQSKVSKREYSSS